MEVNFSYISNCGERKVNEDSIGVLNKEDRFLFALADGLGGHGLGDRASKIAVETSLNTFSENDAEPEVILEDCFINSQIEILKKQESLDKHESLKTTLVNLLIDNYTAQWGYIGDSRLYLFRKNKFTYRTSDHSVPQMLYKMGDIKEKDIRFHVDRNKLLRVLGVKGDRLKHEITKEPLVLKSKDTFLLCSDGFWEWISERDMVKLLRKSTNVNQWLVSMEKLVLKAGLNKSMDNYSAIAVSVE